VSMAITLSPIRPPAAASSKYPTIPHMMSPPWSVGTVKEAVPRGSTLEPSQHRLGPLACQAPVVHEEGGEQSLRRARRVHKRYGLCWKWEDDVGPLRDR